MKKNVIYSFVLFIFNNIMRISNVWTFKLQDHKVNSLKRYRLIGWMRINFVILVIYK